MKYRSRPPLPRPTALLLVVPLVAMADKAARVLVPEGHDAAVRAL